MDHTHIIQSIGHRPWVLPAGRWAYYQEWNEALFLHWRVKPEILQPMIPKGTTLDLCDGSAWVSLVAFTMDKIRPRQLPALSFISTFHEINVRTYVTAGDKAGVYFLSMEGSKAHAVWTARKLSGLPYEYALMHRDAQQEQHQYHSVNKARGFRLHASFKAGKPVTGKTNIDNFLTEKYCLYYERAAQLYRYEVQHLPWNLYDVQVEDLVNKLYHRHTFIASYT